MERILEFETQEQRQGAELIIDPIIEGMLMNGSLKTHLKETPSEKSLRYVGVPDQVFDLAEQRPMWPLLAFAGELPKLIDLVLSIEDRVGDSYDPMAEIRTIQDELHAFSQIGR